MMNGLRNIFLLLSCQSPVACPQSSKALSRLGTGSQPAPSRHLIRRHLAPATNDVPAEGADAGQGFVIVEVEVTVHGGGLGDAGSGEVDDRVGAGAVEFEISGRRVDGAREAGVAAEGKVGASRQSPEREAVGGAIAVGGGVAGQARTGG